MRSSIYKSLECFLLSVLQNRRSATAIVKYCVYLFQSKFTLKHRYLGWNHLSLYNWNSFFIYTTLYISAKKAIMHYVPFSENVQHINKGLLFTVLLCTDYHKQSEQIIWRALCSWFISNQANSKSKRSVPSWTSLWHYFFRIEARIRWLWPLSNNTTRRWRSTTRVFSLGTRHFGQILFSTSTRMIKNN